MKHDGDAAGTKDSAQSLRELTVYHNRGAVPDRAGVKTGENRMNVAQRTARIEAMRVFLSGGDQPHSFVTLDPSSFAAIFAGRPGGSPTAARRKLGNLESHHG